MGNIFETFIVRNPYELGSPARHDSQKRKRHGNRSENHQYTNEEIIKSFFSPLTHRDKYRMNPGESLSYKRMTIHQSLFLVYREVYFRQDIYLVGGFKVPKNVIFSFLIVDSCTEEWMALDTLLRPLYYKVKIQAPIQMVSAVLLAFVLMHTTDPICLATAKLPNLAIMDLEW